MAIHRQFLVDRVWKWSNEVVDTNHVIDPIFFCWGSFKSWGSFSMHHQQSCYHSWTCCGTPPKQSYLLSRESCNKWREVELCMIFINLSMKDCRLDEQIREMLKRLSDLKMCIIKSGLLSLKMT